MKVNAENNMCFNSNLHSLLWVFFSSQGIPAALLVAVQRNQGGASRRSRVQPGEIWPDLQPGYVAAQALYDQSTGHSAENTSLVSCVFLCTPYIHIKIHNMCQQFKIHVIMTLWPP